MASAWNNKQTSGRYDRTRDWSWWQVLKRTVAEFRADNVTDWAAALTYYAVLSIFPGLIAIFSLLGVDRSGQGRQRRNPGDHRPGRAGRHCRRDSRPNRADGQFIGCGVRADRGNRPGDLGGVRVRRRVQRAMNRIYEIDEGRPFWKLKPIQLLVTVITIILMVATAIISRGLRPGHKRGRKRARPRRSRTDCLVDRRNGRSWRFIVVLIVAILYYATPNAKQPKFRWISLGALLAICGARGGDAGVRVLRRELLQLRQDLRVARGHRRLPVVALDREPRPAVRRGVRRRTGRRIIHPSRGARG